MNRKQRRAMRNAPKRYTETDMLEESRTTSRSRGERIRLTYPQGAPKAI